MRWQSLVAFVSIAVVGALALPVSDQQNANENNDNTSASDPATPHSRARRIIPAPRYEGNGTVIRIWMEELLFAIRRDTPRPTVHARNQYHVTLACWDAFAIVRDDVRLAVMTERDRQHVRGHIASMSADEVAAYVNETVSHAAFTLLSARFDQSAGRAEQLASFQQRMTELGYNFVNTATTGYSAAALGNRIGTTVEQRFLHDGANEHNDYAANNGYTPVNSPLIVDGLGVGDTVVDPNRWQSLALDSFVTQNGIVLGDVPDFVGPHWGGVKPFGMRSTDRSSRGVYFDPGPPPYLNGTGHNEFIQDVITVLRFSALLDPTFNTTLDISPASIGNNTLGVSPSDGTGWSVNPVTGAPYAHQVHKLGDYGRILAEYWADGLDSETPPGHWNTLVGFLTDHEDVELRYEGKGPLLDPLEWDAKLYLALAGAMHDAAVAAWGCKGHYDYVRPITAVRYTTSPAVFGTNMQLPEVPGLIEFITAESAAFGERHYLLRFSMGRMACFAYNGPPSQDHQPPAGVGWILCERWTSYQRPNFVTPPFAGYVSGHSTFSRAGAYVLHQFTGSATWPGGLGRLSVPKDHFLEFETGPSEDMELRWSTFYDSADEAGVSRIYGGIHSTADDSKGRIMGQSVGERSMEMARFFYTKPCSIFCTPLLANRVCDAQCNVTECSWDLGDCVVAHQQASFVFDVSKSTETTHTESGLGFSIVVGNATAACNGAACPTVTVRQLDPSTLPVALNSSVSARSRFYEVTPHGVTFAELLELRVDVVELSGENLQLWRLASPSASQWEIVAGVEALGGKLMGHVNTFSYFVAATDSAQTPAALCDSNPCGNGATCADDGVTYTCTCPAGITGTLCDTDILECVSSPCMNGASCVEGTNSFVCMCVEGMTGDLCESDTDECASSPCVNGGTCTTPSLGVYACQCMPGFTSEMCQENFNECVSSPCENGATCVDAVNGYTCTCVAGFAGPSCATNTNECVSSPCQNGATCIDQLGMFTCTCVAGYTDAVCSSDIDECASNPCGAGGTCTTAGGVGSFVCTCPSGMTGVQCLQAVNECASSPCQNGASCVDQADGFACTCASGFSGVTCASDMDECASSPCLNGGTCTDQVDAFVCTCTAGLTGPACGVLVVTNHLSLSKTAWIALWVSLICGGSLLLFVIVSFRFGGVDGDDERDPETKAESRSTVNMIDNEAAATTHV